MKSFALFLAAAALSSPFIGPARAQVFTLNGVPSVSYDPANLIQESAHPQSNQSGMVNWIVDAPLFDPVYRNLGPFRAGSWVPDIAVPDSPPRDHLYTFYVAARNGGVWKTTNNGTTFQPIFNDQPYLSIGALAIAHSNPDIVWVGSGDASCTRSEFRGNGVYKSTDAGKTWTHLGLDETHHIARVVIDPRNPDVVYVAAMGHMYIPNEDRGVFKTTDGGKSWKKILYLNDRTGVIDLVLDRQHPETLYAASYECLRHPWQILDGGPGTGIHKTTDGGVTWQRLGGGLPSGTIGRIGIDISRQHPEIIYALIDNRNRSTNPPPAGRGRGAGAGPVLVGGEAYRSTDGGVTWKKMSPGDLDLSRKSGYAFNQLRVNPTNADQIYITGETLAMSADAGKTWSSLTETRASRPFARAFGDFRCLWIDPDNPDHMLAGSDGGVSISYDGGRTCDHFPNLPLGEVYAVAVDMETPYNVYAGLQDHESWRGPSQGWSGSIDVEDWSTVGTGDGMYNQVDPTDSRWSYSTQEFSSLARYDQKTRTRKVIAPTLSADSDLRQLRFNWVAPFRLSPHDPKTIYAGAQVLFRSKDRGDHWEVISPDLTSNDTNKISPRGAAIQHCTITTISESPARAGVIWVGTDDGKVQVTQDSGGKWSDVTPAITKLGVPEDAWTTRVCASPNHPGTAYVAKSRHRQDDFRPFLFVTTDFGATWKAITNGLPQRPVNVVFEDYTNSDLLFAGTDSGVYFSFNGGNVWLPLKGNMPSVPVNDLLVHPRDGDLVVGTFGRGLWITDIRPLRELSDAMLAEPAHFCAIQPPPPRQPGAVGNYRLYGDRHAVVPNESSAIIFTYFLKSATENVSLTITDPNGAEVRAPEATGKAGFNRVAWNTAPGGRGGGGGGRSTAPPRMVAGTYTVTLKVGDKTYSQKAQVQPPEPSDSANPDADSDDPDADADSDMGN